MVIPGMARAAIFTALSHAAGGTTENENGCARADMLWPIRGAPEVGLLLVP
jgi:hypothetical protein